MLNEAADVPLTIYPQTHPMVNEAADVPVTIYLLQQFPSRKLASFFKGSP